MNEEINAEELITEFVEKNGNRNMYLAKVRGQIKRKGFKSLSEKEVRSLLKRIKDKDGAMPFDYEVYQEKEKEKIYE
jgi:hypothetical protein